MSKDDGYKSLKKTKADIKAREEAMGEPGEIEASPGVDLHLDDHHLEKLGLPKDLPHGHEVELHFRGHVHRSTHEEGPEGESGRTHLKLTHGKVVKGAEHDATEPVSDLREELEHNHDESEGRRTKAEAARAEKREKKDEKSEARKGKDE